MPSEGEYFDLGVGPHLGDRLYMNGIEVIINGTHN